MQFFLTVTYSAPYSGFKLTCKVTAPSVQHSMFLVCFFFPFIKGPPGSLGQPGQPGIPGVKVGCKEI